MAHVPSRCLCSHSQTWRRRWGPVQAPSQVSPTPTPGPILHVAVPTYLHTLRSLTPGLHLGPSYSLDHNKDSASPELFPSESRCNLRQLKDAPDFKVDWRFWKRCGRILGLAFDWPWRNPITWFVLIVSIYASARGAMALQLGVFDVVAGITACLQHGCKGKPPPGDADELWKLCVAYGGHLFTLVTGLFVGKFMGEICTARCRYRVNRTLQERIFHGSTLYFLVVLDQRVDNFDQRLTTDLQAFLDSFLGQLTGNVSYSVFLPVVFQIPSTFYSLITVSKLNVPMVGQIWIFFFLFSVILFIIPMNRIAKIFYLQQNYEGDLRFMHARSITHCESIAFYGGEERERWHANDQYSRMYFNSRR